MGATPLSFPRRRLSRGPRLAVRSAEFGIIPQTGSSDTARALVAGEKLRLRLAALARRDGLSEADRASGSAAVSAAVLALPLEASAVVSAFVPIRSEVDLTAAIAGLHGRGQAVCLPVPVGDQLLFRRHRPGEALVPLGFGTRGPGPEADEVVPDVLLMPLSAFDRGGGRMGYGRGFYDRAVAGLVAAGRTPRLIGVAFSVQEVAAVPMEAHDVPLAMLITERETLSFIRGRP